MQDFLRLWTGQSISELGSQVSQLAIPWLAAFGLHASPIEFSLLAVLGFLPFILFALPAGVWVDRLRRRRILIVGDSARAVLLALIPVLWAFGVLRIGHLLVLQFASASSPSSSTSPTSRTCRPSSSASTSSTGTRSCS